MSETEDEFRKRLRKLESKVKDLDNDIGYLLIRTEGWSESQKERVRHNLKKSKE